MVSRTYGWLISNVIVKHFVNRSTIKTFGLLHSVISIACCVCAHRKVLKMFTNSLIQSVDYLLTVR